jgi:hypothetical protein
VSNQLPPDVRHVLGIIALVMIIALTVAILGGRAIAYSWRNSPTADWLRWRATDLRAAMAYPFRLLRKRRPKTTAGAGAPTLLPPVAPRKDTP